MLFSNEWLHLILLFPVCYFWPFLDRLIIHNTDYCSRIVAAFPAMDDVDRRLIPALQFFAGIFHWPSLYLANYMRVHVELMPRLWVQSPLSAPFTSFDFPSWWYTRHCIIFRSVKRSPCSPSPDALDCYAYSLEVVDDLDFLNQDGKDAMFSMVELRDMISLLKSLLLNLYTARSQIFEVCYLFIRFTVS